MWDAQTGQELFALKGHLGSSIKDMGFSPDGKRLLTSTGGRYLGEIKIWDAETGQEMLNFKYSDGSNRLLGHFSPDGNWLVALGGNNVRIYNATPLPEKP